MNINLNIDTKQINPGVINLRQFTTGTDVLVFEMDNYMYETTDLSTLNAYAVCDMGGRIDEVKLTTAIVEDKLRITWHVTGYTTEVDGTLTYQIVFKNIENELSKIWYSHKAIIFVNSDIDADGFIAGKYPTILQQWEQRMNNIDEQVNVDVAEIREAVTTTTNNAEQTAIDAENALNAANSASAILSNIKILVNYEPVDAIGMEVMQARGDYDLLGLRLDVIEAAATSGQTTINRETFTATANQHSFTLTKGTYTLGGNYLTVYVNGSLQPSEALIETDESTFGLVEGLEIAEGDIIDVTYYLITASPNMETPDGAQKKVDTLQTWTNIQLGYKLGKEEAASTYEKKPLTASTSLLASKWTGSSYIVELQGVTANSTQHVTLAQAGTKEQYEALAAACLIQGTQTTNQFTLKALGDVPTIDIPIVVVVEGV